MELESLKTTARSVRPAAARWLRRLLPLLPLLLLGPLLPYLLATTTSESLERAIDVQRALIEERPGDGSVWSDLGNLLALAGELEAAEQAYDEALRLDPDLFDAHYNLGLLLLGDERFDAAATRLREAAALDSGSAWARYHLGSSLRARGRRADAIRNYAEAFRLDPRLAFADVNPDVIQNPWLTEALLLAHRKQQARGDSPSGAAAPAQVASAPRRSSEPRTSSDPSRTSTFRTYSEPATISSSPRSYSEPERIAELLVPHSASSAAHSLTPRTEPTSRNTVVAPAEPVASAAQRRRLDLVPSELEELDDLDPVDEPAEDRELRRVAPATSSTPARIGVPGVVAAPEARRQVGPGDLTDGGRVEEGGGQIPDDAPEPSSPVTRFRPGRRSSAQLDLILLPRGADPRLEASGGDGGVAGRR